MVLEGLDSAARLRIAAEIIRYPAARWADWWIFYGFYSQQCDIQIWRDCSFLTGKYRGEANSVSERNVNRFLKSKVCGWLWCGCWCRYTRIGNSIQQLALDISTKEFLLYEVKSSANHEVVGKINVTTGYSYVRTAYCTSRTYWTVLPHHFLKNHSL